MDISTYISGITQNITDQTLPNTIPPTIVGNGFTDLANITQGEILALSAYTLTNINSLSASTASNINTLSASTYTSINALSALTQAQIASVSASTSTQFALKENLANKAIDFSTLDNNKYATTLAVSNYVNSAVTNVNVTSILIKNANDITAGLKSTGMFLLSSTQGLLNASGSIYQYSSFIPVIPNTKYRFTSSITGSTGGVAAYNIDQNFLNDIPSGSTIKRGTIITGIPYTQDFITPVDCYWLRLGASTASTIGISLIGSVATTDNIDYNNAGLGCIPSVSTVKRLNDKAFSVTDISTAVLSAALSILSTSTGAYTSTSGTYNNTDYIAVNPGDTLYITAQSLTLCGYDQTKTYLSTSVNGRRQGALIIYTDVPEYPYPTGSTQNSGYLFYNFKFIVPTQVYYIRASANVTTSPTFLITREAKLISDRTDEATVGDITSGLISNKYVSPKSFKAYLTANGGTGSEIYVGAKADYGCTGNAQLISSASTVAGSNIVNCPSASFNSDDIGKVIGIPYAGANTGATGIGQTFLSTITGITSTTSIALGDNVIQTITGAKTLTDGAMTINSDILTSATAGFLLTDVGKEIVIGSAGQERANTTTAGFLLTCRIISYISTTSVEVSKKAFRTVSGATFIMNGATIIYGTDDTTKLQLAFDTTATNKQELILEQGKYLTTNSLIVSSNLHVKGLGASSSSILPVGNTSGICGIKSTSGSTSNPYYDIQLRDFEINCIGVTLTTYDSGTKCIYNTYQVRPVFENLRLRNSCGTALGCDFLVNGYIAFNTIELGGRQVKELGQSAGGSGIGVGTGFWQEEPTVVIGNTVLDCGNNGIFFECQTGTVQSQGIRIIGNYVNGCAGSGIADKGTKGILITDNTVELCSKGIEVGIGFNPLIYSSDGSIINNKVLGCGIVVAYQIGSYNVRGNDILAYNTDYLYMSQGIQVNCVGTTSLTDLNIEDNRILDNLGYGISVVSGSFRRLKIKNNDFVNLGSSTSGSGFIAAIDIQAAQTNLYLVGNTIFDTRASGAKYMSLGFRIGAVAISRYYNRDNDIFGMGTAVSDISAATITTTV